MGLVKSKLPETGFAEADDQSITRGQFLTLLRSGEPGDRVKAARVAKSIDDGAALVASSLAGEQNPRVVEAFLLSLTDCADDKAISIVIEHLRMENAGLRNGVIDLLMSKSDMFERRLEALLQDPETDFRIMLVNAAASIVSKDAQSILCRALPKEQDDNVCGAIIEVLADIGDGPEALAAAKAAAERFASHPFLAFAADMAVRRIVETTEGAA